MGGGNGHEGEGEGTESLKQSLYLPVGLNAGQSISL